MLADRVRAASLDLDEQLALVVRLEDAIEQRADRRLLAAVLADLLDREDLYARVSRRLEGVRAALADAPPAPVPAPERAPVTLLARRPGRWSLRVGWTTLVVSIDGHQPTVTVDGEPILFTSRQRGVRTFLLPGPDGRPVDAALLWNGPDGSDGLRLTVDHVTAYGDGIHA
jgi:hypothetical protein